MLGVAGYEKIAKIGHRNYMKDEKRQERQGKTCGGRLNAEADASIANTIVEILRGGGVTIQNSRSARKGKDSARQSQGNARQGQHKIKSRQKQDKERQ